MLKRRYKHGTEECINQSETTKDGNQFLELKKQIGRNRINGWKPISDDVKCTGISIKKK